MFERLTDRARRVLVLAQEEARLLKHEFIGSEHILLGLIHEGEGVAAQVLLKHTTLEELRDLLYVAADPARDAPTPVLGGSPPFTPRARKVLEFSLREALQLGHNYIGTEHILLGLIREGQGQAAKVLEELDVGGPELRTQVIDTISGYVKSYGVAPVADPPEEIAPKQPFTDDELEAIALLGGMTADQVRSVAWMTTLRVLRSKTKSRM